MANPKAVKRLGKNLTVQVNDSLIETLRDYLGEKNLKVLEKNIEKLG